MLSQTALGFGAPLCGVTNSSTMERTGLEADRVHDQGVAFEMPNGMAVPVRRHARRMLLVQTQSKIKWLRREAHRRGSYRGYSGRKNIFATRPGIATNRHRRVNAAVAMSITDEIITAGGMAKFRPSARTPEFGKPSPSHESLETLGLPHWPVCLVPQGSDPQVAALY